MYENGFDLYMRFNPDNPPKTICVEGKSKNYAKIHSQSLEQHRQL